MYIVGDQDDLTKINLTAREESDEAGSTRSSSQSVTTVDCYRLPLGHLELSPIEFQHVRVVQVPAGKRFEVGGRRRSCAVNTAVAKIELGLKCE